MSEYHNDPDYGKDDYHICIKCSATGEHSEFYSIGHDWWCDACFNDADSVPRKMQEISRLKSEIVALTESISERMFELIGKADEPATTRAVSVFLDGYAFDNKVFVSVLKGRLANLEYGAIPLW